MSRIDRYVLSLYLRVLLICMASLSGLLILIHVFSNLDEFSEYCKARGSALRGFVGFYGPFTLAIFDRLCGLLAVTTTLCAVGWLHRTNEMTAIQAAGIGKKRVLAPLLIASVFLFLAAAANREWLIPRFASTLGQDLKDLTGSRTAQIRPIFDEEYGVLIGGRHLLPNLKEIADPIFRLEGVAAKYGKQLTAISAKFRESNELHGRGFLMDAVRTPNELCQQRSIRNGNELILGTPIDCDWLQPNQCWVSTSLSYDLLKESNRWKDTASTWQIIRRLRQDARYFQDDVRVTLHARVVQPFLDGTLLLLGLPLVLNRSDSRIVWIAGSAILLVTGFMLFIIAVQTLGASGTFLSPVTAAWLPLILIMPIAWTRARPALAG